MAYRPSAPLHLIRVFRPATIVSSSLLVSRAISPVGGISDNSQHVKTRSGVIYNVVTPQIDRSTPKYVIFTFSANKDGQSFTTTLNGHQNQLRLS
ncbi:hypothetical protein C8R44DRAFT_869448 [Mycena epipterygia]|nr:hypothetical protein C8R44DRAFT_869448 [Mycena epipterygia]